MGFYLERATRDRARRKNEMSNKLKPEAISMDPVLDRNPTIRQALSILKAVSVNVPGYNEARARAIDLASKDAQGAAAERMAAREALASGLEVHCTRVGHWVRESVAKDAAYLRADPRRVPAELVSLVRTTVRLDGIAKKLGGTAGRCVRAFETAVGTECMQILTAALRLEPMPAVA